MEVDLRVAQLLCSRLCHDLVGPAGAVNAGCDLIAETGGDDDGALALLATSGRQMTRRLAFYRAAFGLGGAGDLMEARRLAADLLAEGPVVLDWPAAGEQRSEDVQLAKLVLNLILIGAESLPRGGRLAVHVADLPEGTGVALTANGQGARIKDEVRAAMAPRVDADDLSARTVHGHLGARLAEALGAAIEVSAGEADEVRMAVLIPGGAGGQPWRERA